MRAMKTTATLVVALAALLGGSAASAAQSPKYPPAPCSMLNTPEEPKHEAGYNATCKAGLDAYFGRIRCDWLEGKLRRGYDVTGELAKCDADRPKMLDAIAKASALK
jgi:hypothetical protein